MHVKEERTVDIPTTHFTEMRLIPTARNSKIEKKIQWKSTNPFHLTSFFSRFHSNERCHLFAPNAVIHMIHVKFEKKMFLNKPDFIHDSIFNMCFESFFDWNLHLSFGKLHRGIIFQFPKHSFQFPQKLLFKSFTKHDRVQWLCKSVLLP